MVIRLSIVKLLSACCVLLRSLVFRNFMPYTVLSRIYCFIRLIALFSRQSAAASRAQFVPRSVHILFCDHFISCLRLFNTVSHEQDIPDVWTSL
jgi:hypothetical protein